MDVHGRTPGRMQHLPDPRQPIGIQVVYARHQGRPIQPSVDVIRWEVEADRFAQGFKIRCSNQLPGEVPGKIAPIAKGWGKRYIRVGKPEAEQPAIGLRLKAPVQIILEQPAAFADFPVRLIPLQVKPTLGHEDGNQVSGGRCLSH
ncbi:MAG: hypothetical protein KFF68_00315 [Desulfosarcina sp.]|nr:hypothetical protein [Desulfosarcina sp.]